MIATPEFWVGFASAFGIIYLIGLGWECFESAKRERRIKHDFDDEFFRK